jgi:hypothetical protein
MADMNPTTKKVVAVVLCLCIILSVVAATGVFYVPGFSEALGTNKARDLGVKADPAKFDALLARENVKLTGPASKYDLTANIRYGQAVPMDATVTSEELTSLMQATNNAQGPLKNMQVRLGTNNQLEMSADADLQKFGYPVKGPVYLKGTLIKAGPGSVKMTVSEGAFGLVPVPADMLNQGKDGLEQAVNRQLAGMPGLKIDTLSIDNGQLHYTGSFPATASA